jgi:glyoxylase-like metal-dependent hydrolase (beta-lactamase superfamily II)
LALLAVMGAGTGAQDARGVLQAVATNIGADNLTTLQISGTAGWSSAPGASYGPNDDWPRFELTAYSKQIDFNARFLREQITRQWGRYPQLGGGQGVPAQGTHTLDVALNGNVAWTIAGGGAGPLDREGYMDGVPIAELRQLDVMLTPHGFVKAALAPGANPIMVTSMPRGRRVTYVSITALGKYRVAATINDRNEIEFVQTHVANPMFGDMLYEVRYGPYRQFGAVKFPSVIHHHEGDDRLNPGHNALEVQVSAVQANAPVQVLTPPDSAKAPPMSVATVESQKLAEGVWYVGGIRHASVAVEFRDFVAVVEAPLNEKRSIAVINEVYRLARQKPIRYLVNTHHHFDHAGGLRTFVAEGATIVTHQTNREFYDKAVFSPAPRTLEPDRLFLLNPDVVRDPVFELVNQKYVISDGTRTLDVYPVPAFDHASSMVFAYLPRERLAVNADMYTPPKPGAPLPKPSQSTRMLLQTIQRLGLDVVQHVGLHGGVGPHEDLIKIVGQPATN